MSVLCTRRRDISSYLAIQGHLLTLRLIGLCSHPLQLLEVLRGCLGLLLAHFQRLHRQAISFLQLPVFLLCKAQLLIRHVKPVIQVVTLLQLLLELSFVIL